MIVNITSFHFVKNKTKIDIKKKHFIFVYEQLRKTKNI